MKVKQFLIFALLCSLTSVVFADITQRFKLIGGQDSSLAEMMVPGQWNVVMIWSADCHVCNLEAGKYNEFQSQHANVDANVIGISLDGTEAKAHGFVKRHQLIYPNLVGSVQEVANLYGTETGESFRATPSFMLYSPSGELKAAQAGGVSPEVIERFMANSAKP